MQSDVLILAKIEVKAEQEVNISTDETRSFVLVSAAFRPMSLVPLPFNEKAV